MEEYADISGRSGEVIADTMSNRMRLRCDAHRLWDKLKFSIVPCDSNDANLGPMWITQATSDGDELHQYWHGQKLQPLAMRPPQFLFARFAWDIFPKLHAFLQAGQKRHLVICGADGVTECRYYDESESRELTVGQGRNRSASPKKRSRSSAGDHVEDLPSIQARENDTSTYVHPAPFAAWYDPDIALLLADADSRDCTEEVLTCNDSWHRHLRGEDVINEVRGRKRVRV